MPKPFRYILLFLCLLLVILCISSLAKAAEEQRAKGNKGDISIPPDDIETIEVLYFHPRFRCVSCNNVEKFAREVVKNEFSEETKEGKVVFKSLEVDDPANAKLVKELGVTGSSLFIVAIGKGKREYAEIKDVWLNWNNPKKCRDIIRSQIRNVLETGKSDGGELPLAGVPVVLAALLLGLLTAVSPCPLATNIAALSYVSKKLEDRRYTVFASVLYTAGRMFAYTLVGVFLVLIGLNASRVSLFFQRYADWFLGPLLIFFGLVMLDILKISIFKGRATAAIQAKIGDWGLVSSFLLGVLFALAFCPYSAIIFFGMLIPIALDSSSGIALPAIYGLATGIPVIIFAIALSLGVSEIGKHVERIQKYEKYFRWFAGIVFIGVGIYYLVVLIRSLF